MSTSSITVPSREAQVASFFITAHQTLTSFGSVKQAKLPVGWKQESLALIYRVISYLSSRFEECSLFMRELGTYDSLQGARIGLMKKRVEKLKESVLKRVDSKDGAKGKKVEDLFRGILTNLDQMALYSEEEAVEVQQRIKSYIRTFKNIEFHKEEKILSEIAEAAKKSFMAHIASTKNSINEEMRRLVSDVGPVLNRYGDSRVAAEYQEEKFKKLIRTRFEVIERTFEDCMREINRLDTNTQFDEINKLIDSVERLSPILSRQAMNQIKDYLIPSVYDTALVKKCEDEFSRLEDIFTSSQVSALSMHISLDETSQVMIEEIITHKFSQLRAQYNELKISIMGKLNKANQPSRLSLEKAKEVFDTLAYLQLQAQSACDRTVIEAQSDINAQLEALKASLEQADEKQRDDEAEAAFIEELQRTQGLVCQAVERNGHCLFNSVLALLKSKGKIGEDVTVIQYRNDLYDFMKTNIDKYKEAIQLYLIADLHNLKDVENQSAISQTISGCAPLLLAKYQELWKFLAYDQRALAFSLIEANDQEGFRALWASCGFEKIEDVPSAFTEDNKEIVKGLWNEAASAKFDKEGNAFIYSSEETAGVNFYLDAMKKSTAYGADVELRAIRDKEKMAIQVFSSLEAYTVPILEDRENGIAYSKETSLHLVHLSKSKHYDPLFFLSGS